MQKWSDLPDDGQPVIELIDVVKKFYHYEHRTTTLQEFFTRFLSSQAIHVRATKYDLSGVSLRVMRGDSVALIGANGSGKSTTLRMMAGIYQPTQGRIVRRGRMVAVIELGATFQATLTGVENVRLYAAALGYTRREVEEQMDAILEFSGVGDFRDVPIKYYSTGMKSRLAFAIAAFARPDVLLLDEILAVGDSEFKFQCYERVRAFQAQGGTLVLVSHDMNAVRELCQHAVWLEHGRVRAVGTAAAVTEAYDLAVHLEMQAANSVASLSSSE